MDGSCRVTTAVNTCNVVMEEQRIIRAHRRRCGASTPTLGSANTNRLIASYAMVRYVSDTIIISVVLSHARKHARTHIRTHAVTHANTHVRTNPNTHTRVKYYKNMAQTERDINMGRDRKIYIPTYMHA